MKTFERITTVDHTGRRKTQRMQIISEGPAWLRAYVVDAEGQTTEDHYDGDTLVIVEHLIEKACIVKRVALRMNRHYGTLEPVA